MAEPAYVVIAGELARRIRAGELEPGTKLPSLMDLAEQQGVSEIVIRKAVSLLLSQGLVRTVERRGTFVAEKTTLVRVSPERQVESAEMSFGNESDSQVYIDRTTRRVPATADLAEAFGVKKGDELVHVVTLAAEDGKPISVSDTYELADGGDSTPSFLEETIADRPPAPNHAEWLGTPSGELVKTVHQRFLAGDDRVVMISDVSYPRDRYDAFVFRMTLPRGAEENG